ncbi:MAG: transporter substrate-binding protein [Ramlibacter sp.]|nr:transporter substrate-binding protein [Ramlibacter sp.]
MRRRELVAGISGAVLGFGSAAAVVYPTRPIRWLVGFAAGGASDIVVRLTAEGMQKELGVPVIVDNRPGASGNLAVSALVQAPPDGYTILHGENSVLYTNEHLSRLAYSPERDFTYIGAIGRSPFTLVVNPGFPAQTLTEFVEYAKANPAKINYGTPGVGSPQRIAMEVFQQEYGVKLTHVAYRGGAPALLDVRSGQIEAMMTDLSISLPYIRDGGLRALAVYAPKRLASIPAIPTFSELGFGSVSAFILHGLVGPAGMPRPVVERLNAALHVAMKSPKVVSNFTANGLQAEPGTPEDFEKFVRQERSRAASIIKSAGIKAE